MTQHSNQIESVLRRAVQDVLLKGLNDPRVAYWEPTKWTQRLRAAAPDGGADVLLKMDMGAGHFSASDRYKFYRETAYDQAWLLDQHGLAEPIAAAPAKPAASSSS